MVNSNLEYYRETSRKAALMECLDAFVQYAQPYAQRSDIGKNIGIAQSIINKLKRD